jgi:hypothetical protein
MAEPTKEELELMMRMILGKKYDPDFDPRTLGKREDAAVGPHPDWDPKDGDVHEVSWELFDHNSPLSWKVWIEQERQKKIQKRKDAIEKWLLMNQK